MLGLGDTLTQQKPVVGPDQIGSQNDPNPESTSPIRMEVGESSSLADPRPPTPVAHVPMKPNIAPEASVAQNEVVGRHAEPTREVKIKGGCGLHGEESPTAMVEADTERNHCSRKTMSSVVCETSTGYIEKLG